jgi:hypothetical protein
MAGRAGNALRRGALFLIALMIIPTIAPAAEALVDLEEERVAPCCPAHDDTPGEPAEPDDCSRTCRACHCCLPIADLASPLPEVASPAVCWGGEPFAALRGEVLPAHTRSPFRPPAHGSR